MLLKDSFSEKQLAVLYLSMNALHGNSLLVEQPFGEILAAKIIGPKPAF